MAQPPKPPLQGMAIYLDRTVYSRIFEKGKKMQLKEKVKIMGGTLVDDPNEAAIILGHPGRTLLDYAYTDTRAMMVSYHYVEEHCGDRNAPSYLKYRTYVQPRADSPFSPAVSVGPAAPVPDLLVDSDPEVERDEVECAVSPERDMHSAEKEVLVGAPSFARAESQDRRAPSPRVRRPTGRSAQTRADGGKALPAAPEAAPVPTFRVPESSAFRHDEVRDWACSFVRWAATYSPIIPDSTLIRKASVQMSKIARQLRISSFRNYVVKEKEFSARVTQVIRHARTHAERNSIQEIREKEMTALVSAAGREYRSQYDSLANLAKPSAAAPTPVPSTSKNAAGIPAIPPPQLPDEIFYPNGQRQNLFNEAGHAYMRQAFRWLLLVHPTRKWGELAAVMKAASNEQVSQRAFLEYRKCSAFVEILEEYEADPAAFRTAYENMRRETQPVEDDSVPDGEPARKRRRIEQRTPNRASSSTTRAPSPTYSELSPTATVDPDGSDYCD